MFRSGNPALSQLDKAEQAFEAGEVMTISGTVNKTGILLGLCLITAATAWSLGDKDQTLIQPMLIGGAISGLIFALITMFKPNAAPYTAPIYALCEGFFLGSLSLFVQRLVGDPTGTPIVAQAAGLTFGTLGAMLFAYRTGIVKCTDKFRAGITAAVGAIFLMYMVTFLLGLFGVNVPYIHSGGPIGIGISLVVIVIAALSLVLDFDFIQRGSEQGAPKRYEWIGAFGLMVTLVWLYVEILHLLMKLQSRD